MCKQETIQALIFNFDGLIVDSETAIYQAWQEIYQRYHCTLPLERWVQRIGSSAEFFDAHAYLESLVGHPL